MAEHIRANASIPIETVSPKSGQAFTLPEMQEYVGGYIEAIRLTPELVMYVNEDGTMKALPLNSRATAKLWEYRPEHRGRTYIVGDVLVASKAEQCEVCEKTEGPFIKVEVSDGEDDMTQWLAVCGEECLSRVIIRWTQIGEIVRASVTQAKREPVIIGPSIIRRSFTMSTISTTVANDKLAQVLATGIPFVQTRADLWASAKGYDPEPGDENSTELEYTGTWTAAQDLALERLMSEGVLTGITRTGLDPFPLEEKLAILREAAAIHPALQEKRLYSIENPRYVVHPGRGVVSVIIDTQGQNPPYEIGTNTNERRQSEAVRQRSWAFNRSVAEDWAYTWNLVELGHCGLCKRKIAEIPGYQSGPNGEPPRHQHTFGHQMYRRLCFECSCSQDD